MADRAIQIEAFTVGFLEAGSPLTSGQVTVYLEGTTTKAAIYTKANKTVEASNPVTLDSNGQSATPIFVDDNFKLLIQRSDLTTFKTLDELTGTVGNIQVEHESDGTHSVGIIADAEVAAGAAIARSKIANDTVAHNSDGTHKDVRFGDGGLFGGLQTLTQSVYYTMNCRWTGLDWEAYDTAKSAAMLQFNTSTGEVTLRIKDVTSPPWVPWDVTHVLASKTAAASWQTTSDGLTHQATTHRRAISLIAFGSASGLFANALVGDSAGLFMKPAAADGNDYFQTYDLSSVVPEGATIRDVELFGATGVTYGSIGGFIHRQASTTEVQLSVIPVVSGGTATTNLNVTIPTDYQTFSYRLTIVGNVAAGGSIANDSKLYRAVITYTTVNLKQT